MVEEVVSQNLVGVDIAPDNIRVVELERAGQEYFLRNIGIAPTPEGAMEDGFIGNPHAVGRVLRDIFRETGIRTKRVITALRGPGAAARLIVLPSMPHERMRTLIETEVTRYIRFSEEDKVVYYHPMEEFEEDGRRKISVLLVIARKDLSIGYYDACRAAGLEVAAVGLSCFAVLRVLRNNLTAFPPGSLMSVIFDHDGVAVNILHADTMRFFRSIKTDSAAPDAYANGFMDKVLSELMLTVHFYEEEYTRREGIKKMVLSMAAGGDRETPMRIAETFAAIPVEMHAPFTNIRVDPGAFPAHVMEQVDLGFLTAVGLALRGRELQPLSFEVDLLPAEISELKTFGRHARYFALALLLVVLGFAGHFGFIAYQTKRMEPELKAVALQSRSLDGKIAAATRKLAGAVKGPAESAAAPRTAAWSAVTDEIRKTTPKNVQLLAVTFDGAAGVELTGAADDNTGIYYFLSALGRSAVLNNARLLTRDDITLNARPAIRFTIQCGYKP